MELHGVVLDIDGLPVAGAEVELYGENLEVPTRITTNPEGVWRSPFFVEDGEEALPIPLQLRASADGFGDALVYWEFSWLDESWLSVPVTFGPGQFVAVGQQQAPAMWLLGEEIGGATGHLVSAVTGGVIDDMEVELRWGFDAPDTDEVLATDVTSASGKFAFGSLQAGVYTARVRSGGGYDASRFPVRLEPFGADNQMGAVVPLLTEESDWAVLIWDEEVAPGLELHLSGPLSTYKGRYQIYPGNTFHPVKGDPVAEMLVLQPGIHSAAVYSLRDGEYRASAFDVDNQLIDGSTALSNSGAFIQLFTPDGVEIEQVVPGTAATSWLGLVHVNEDQMFHKPQAYSEGLDRDDVDDF